MRIFKNRGDIFISSVNKEKSLEQKILLSSLVIIVVFTVIFVTVLAIKNDFSAKKFFKSENLQVSQVAVEENDVPLPQVEGKSNFVTMVHSDGKLLFVILLQVDMDNVSYKASVLKADTVCDGRALNDIYKKSGAVNVKKAVDTLLGTDFDYYISMDNKSFSALLDMMGDFNYPILSDIRAKSKNYGVGYSLKLNAGEQKINGQQYINLIRYYLEERDSTSSANDVVLNSLLQLVNKDNLKISENLFRELVTTAETNITVRDFSLAGDRLTVLTDERTGAGLYGASAEYKDERVTKDSLQKIKGYFVK